MRRLRPAGSIGSTSAVPISRNFRKSRRFTSSIGDTFTVCNGGMNGSRPKEFKPGDGALAEVVVFERERPLSESAKK